MLGPDITDGIIALVGWPHIGIDWSRNPLIVRQRCVGLNGMAKKCKELHYSNP